MSEQITIEAGSISHGTLRSEDLINTFMDYLEIYNPDRAHEIGLEIEGVALFAQTPEELDESREQILHEKIFPAMEALAPEGMYFGNVEGDGSDFGFFNINEEEQNA